MTKIKICGISRFKEIEYVNEAKPDYIGFVFAKSKRMVDLNKAYYLKMELKTEIFAVGVFVNEDMNFIKKCCDMKIIDVVQLSGDENEDYITKLQGIVFKPIIKTIRVGENVKVKIPKYFEEKNILPLFDTYDKNLYGGTGKTFNWEKLLELNTQFILAGGININNYEEAINLYNPYCIDISGGVESNGVKDKDKIFEVVNAIKSVNNFKRRQ